MTHYDRASEIAAHIVNTLLRSDRPTHEIFGCILFLVLDALYEAGPDLTPSDN